MPDPHPRPTLVRSYAHAADIVTGVRTNQLGNPTPCPEFDTAALVDHLVGAGWRAAALGRGETPTGAEFPHVELSDAADELRRAGKDAESAWADHGRLSATTDMPWGETYTGAFLVDMYLAELTVHAWDLAAATNQLDRLDAGLMDDGRAGARSMLRPEYRDVMGKGNPFGVEVEPPAGATEWDRLAAFMGRDPQEWHVASA